MQKVFGDEEVFMAEEVVFVRKASGLIKELGPWSVMSIGMAYVIADGIYNLTCWQSYENPGAFYPLSLLIGFIILAFASFSIVFLTAAMPRTSSDYVAVSRTIHPLLGYIEAILSWGCHVWIVGALAYFQGWYWGSFLIQAGLATHNKAWVSLGEWMSADVGFSIALAIIIVIIFGLVNLFGMKVFKGTLGVLVGIAVIGGAVTAGVAIWSLLVGPGAIPSLWDATYGAGAYNEIVSVAKTAGWADYIAEHTGSAATWGWPGPWSPMATLSACVAAAYAFWGTEFANYAAGEISKPKRSFLLGVVGAMAFIFIYYMLIAVPTLWTYGEFNSYYNYVMYGGNGLDAVKINPQQTPTLAVMLASLIGGVAPWAAIIITITVAIWVLNGLPVYMMVPSRISFALAFDRFFPSKLAEVNVKWHTPHWSILLTVISSIICVFFTAYSPWFYALSVVTMIMVRWLLSSWAAMLMPYEKPEAFEKGFTYKIGKVPLMTIVGAISSALMTILIIIAITQIAGDIFSLGWFMGWIIFATLLYGAYTAYNKAKGVDIEKIFREIPPA